MKTTCCVGDECLEGPEWMTCLEACRTNNNTTVAAIEVYRALDSCVACDACAVSCGENQASDLSYCADPAEVNAVTTPCYQEDAADDQVACFSWAGWGGPCIESTRACKQNPACVTLETCINESWIDDDWHAIQQVCVETAGPEVESLYWAYLQCIYCDACDLACVADAPSKNCSTYTGK